MLLIILLYRSYFVLCKIRVEQIPSYRTICLLLVEKATLSYQNVLILFKKHNFKFNYIIFVKIPLKFYDFSSNNIIVRQNHQVVMSIFDSSNKIGYTSQILYYTQSSYNTFVSFLVLVFGACIFTEPSSLINIFLHTHRNYSSRSIKLS